jgi:hypothetical protein
MLSNFTHAATVISVPPSRPTWFVSLMYAYCELLDSRSREYVFAELVATSVRSAAFH